MKLLKNASIVCLLFFALCFIGGELHSHHITGNVLHPIVSVGNSAHASGLYSSATVSPYIEAEEFGSAGDRFTCSAKVKVDNNPEKVSGTHKKKAPYLYALLVADVKTHTLSMKLSTGTTEIEVAGIGKVKGTLLPGGLNGVVTYTFSWTANKIKADPDFKSLGDFNLHWWFNSGDTFTASASGNASGPQNSDDGSCTATSTARSWAAIPYASAAYCSGDISMSN